MRAGKVKRNPPLLSHQHRAILFPHRELWQKSLTPDRRRTYGSQAQAPISAIRLVSMQYEVLDG
jgi:hypothetical protein